jgi:hypothetical protein
MEALDRELETYLGKLASLLSEEGKFAVISGDSVLGVFDDYESGLKAGYEKCGLRPFLVKKIETSETVQFFAPNMPVG